MLTVLFGDRFDFIGLGAGSANKSAAILACGLVACAWLVLQPRRFWQVAGLAAGVALAMLLVATKSRGGLIAAGCGLGLVVAAARPRLPRWLWGVCLVTAAGVVAYGAMRGVWSRFAYGDDSRAGLWRAGLAMLWDAPGGVGAGRTADFFTQWYQPVDDPRGYLSLINFHLDWLAGRGWVARLGYALAWAGLAWLVWPMGRAGSAVSEGVAGQDGSDRRWMPPCLVTAAGVWLAFFVAAIFSTTATVWQVWVLPLVWLLIAVGWRVRRREWAGRVEAWALAGVSVLALGMLYVAGWGLSDGKLHEAGAQVIRWGGENPRLILYDPNPEVLGEKWGRTLRSQSDSALVLRPGASLPRSGAEGAVWILSGQIPPSLPAGAEVKIFNLPASAELLSWLEKQNCKSVQVTLGANLCDDLKCEVWQSWADGRSNVSVKLVGGGLFVPDWMP